MEPDQREHVSAVINYFWGEGTTSPEYAAVNFRNKMELAKQGL
nr:hypothetical protein [uncultured Marinobacter sp.]